ncbi:uroporphyrinogen-III synthase [Gemmobacter lanyuensis]
MGARTAAEAQALGLEAQSADGDAEALVRLILSDAPPPPLLHLHGAETRGEIAQRLNSAGLETFSQVIYCQKPQPLADPAIAALRERNRCSCLFFAAYRANPCGRTGSHRGHRAFALCRHFRGNRRALAAF